MDAMVQYLELKNSFIGFLMLSMAIIFLTIVWENRARWDKPIWGAASGLAVLTLGLALHQAWYWCWRHFGDQSSAWAFDNLGLLAATVFLIIMGAACTIRNFTLQRFGHSAWVGIIVAAALGALIVWFV